MSTKMNRRVFLRNTAGVAAAMTAGQRAMAGRGDAPVPPPRRGPNEEIRVACIGVRSRGLEHIKGHLGVQNVRVVSLCDVDESMYEPATRLLQELSAPTPKTEYDLRRVLDDKGVDCVSIATPHHWHALAAIWACQAGKDVYVEKPCSHNVLEGRRMIEAARKYGCIMQVGTQGRSAPGIRDAMMLLHQGVIGDVYMARALCFKPRESIGIKEDCAAPASVHYDLWLGPAPVRPFNPNRFHYEWHWNWDYGNGDIGNQGVHQMDIARWGMKETLPIRVQSMGGRYTYKDQGQTPNTQVSTFQFEDGKMLVFEVRGRQTNDEYGVRIGNLFYGSRGYLAIRKDAEGKDSFVTMIDGAPGPSGEGAGDHFQNFHDCVRSRKASDLNAPIEEGHYSSAMGHLANIAWRLGRSLTFDPKTETCGKDAEANALLTRKYRSPYVVPDKV